MEIQLTKGLFNQQDAIELITKLIKAKIEFHEQKIGKSDWEEDIEYRENRMKDLQKDLDSMRNYIVMKHATLEVATTIYVNP